MGNWITALGIPEVSEGLVCCATSAFTGIFSKCSVRHPRFAFSLFLLFGTVASFLVLVPNMRHILDKIPYFCTTIMSDEMCDDLVGYGAVYRICFSLSLFYLTFAVFMVNTTSTADFRYKIHNGYWFVKLVLLVLILVGAFHIPRHTEFGRVLMYAGLTGGFMFIIVQVLLIIDFAHSWSISWAEKVDSGNTSFWYIALAFSTILIYSVAITMAVFFYLFFTDLRNPSKCRGNMFLITFNVSHCVLASVISVLPRVQEEAHGSGLLQSSVVSLYAMYLTWCTLSSEPDGSCNPLSDVVLDYDQAVGVNGQALLDSVLMFALILFACNVRPNTSKLEKIGFSLSRITVAQNYTYTSTFEEISQQKSRDKRKNLDDEENVEEEEKFVDYNYSYFHFIMFLGSLQLMMVVTNWHSPDELADMKKLVKNWATVWIQLSSSILCLLIYIWATVAPLLVRTWGPCLGLDYDLIPTFDEYDYESFRRRAEVIRASDERIEMLEATKSLRKVDKSRQSTLDSGMCDTNVTRTYSRSASRATSENVRLSTQPETKLLGRLESTPFIGPEMDKAHNDDKDDRLAGLQSRQSAVIDRSNGGLLSTSHPSNQESNNKTSEEASKTTLKVSINSSSEIGDKNLQLRANGLGDDGQHSEEYRDSKEKENEKPTKELTITTDGSSSPVEKARKTSPGTKSDDEDPRSHIIERKKSVTDQSRSSSRESRLSEDDRNARKGLMIIEKMRKSTKLEQTVYPTCHSRLSEQTVHDRRNSVDETHRKSRLSSTLSDKNGRKSRSNNERTETDNRLGSSDEHRTVSEAVRTAPDKPRNILPQMEDHIAWVKRLRRKGENLPNKDVIKNKLENEETHNEQHSLSGETKKAETNQFESSVVDRKHQGREKMTESFEIIHASEKENEKNSKRDKSAIFQHPFVHAQGERALSSEPQAPDVAREIMRLQAKILKFQAKVVRSQQQILEIQAEEGAGRQESQLPDENQI